MFDSPFKENTGQDYRINRIIPEFLLQDNGSEVLMVISLG